MSVPQVMDADPGQRGLGFGHIEGLGKGVGVDHSSVDTGEDRTALIMAGEFLLSLLISEGEVGPSGYLIDGLNRAEVVAEGAR